MLKYSLLMPFYGSRKNPYQWVGSTTSLVEEDGGDSIEVLVLENHKKSEIIYSLHFFYFAIVYRCATCVQVSL